MDEETTVSDSGFEYGAFKPIAKDISAEDAWKLNFVFMVSHEFRTPLATIKIAANHIKKYRARMKSEDIDKKINIVLQQAEVMKHMLNSLLTLGQTKENRIEPATRKIEIYQFFEQLCLDVAKVFHNSHTIHLSSRVNVRTIYTDDDLLRNIFVNLLSNAIKFSPGRTAVWVEIANQKNLLSVRIQDEGIGITRDDIDTIFEPFQRGKNAGEIHGTGLGLSIVKKAVDVLNGSIQVSSSPDEGTVFDVTLPLRLNASDDEHSDETGSAADTTGGHSNKSSPIDHSRHGGHTKR